MDIAKQIAEGGFLALAPMAGFTDRAMRLLCRKHGADYAVTEMVSAKAVVYGDKKTYLLARIGEDEGPVGLQIFGSEPQVMAEGAAKLLEHAAKGIEPDGFRSVLPAALDVNMGCPVPKVYNNGEGSALMRDPQKIYDIVRALCDAVKPYSLPVSVKLRAGISKNSRNAVECALAAEEAGAAFITLHPRTREELYNGKADRKYAAFVKSSLHIPMIYSGDVVDLTSAQNAFSVTGAAGIMIGRGAVGNPFLFDELRAMRENKPYAPPSAEETVRTALGQLRDAIDDKGEYVAVSEARKQIALYFRGFRGSASLRAAINRSQTYDEVAAALNSIPQNTDKGDRM